MSRKGRCSNLPDNCELAKNGTLLPFAGLGSICPECGSPLALMRSETQASENLFEEDFAPNGAADSQRRYNSHNAPKRQNGLLNAGLIAAFVVGLGLLAFIGAKLLRPNDDNSATTETIATSQFDPSQVATIEPSIIARASSNLEVKTEPSDEALGVANLGIGAVVDVTGRAIINNIVWARVNVPNRPNQTGYVREDQLIGLNGAPISIGANSSALNNLAPSENVPAPPVIGEIVDTPERIVYIQSNRANIRAEAGPEAVRIGEALRGDTLSIDASRTHNGKIWYRVTLPNGSKGWISGTLVGDKAPAPIAAPTDTNAASSDANSPKVAKEIAAGSRVVITSANVGVHSAASPEEETKIASAERGFVLQVTEISQSGGQTWYKVKSNRLGIDGWIPASAAKSVE